MPKITLLGNGGAVWILSAIGLLATKNTANTARFCWRVGSRRLDRQSDAQAAHRKTSPVLVRFERAASHCKPDGLLVPVRAHALVCHRRDGADEGKPEIWLSSNSARGAHRVSRLYLYVHFPTDILGAAVLGVGIGLVTCTIGDRVRTALAKKGIFLHAR